MGSEKTGKGGGGDGYSKRQGGLRVPPASMLPVGMAVGWLMADWVGAILGGVIGFFLWRSRA
jgi:hypothetical protein